jgi:chromosome condensin MukBEF MukE localization factor
MLVEFSDARRNLLAKRCQVAAQRRRRADSIGTCGSSSGSLRCVEDFAAVAISDDPARDQLRLAVAGGLEALDVDFELVVDLDVSLSSS